MLHASMDALIRDLNANEAARLLILLDDRLTSLINTVAAQPEEKQDRGRTDRPLPGTRPPAAPSMPPRSFADRGDPKPVPADSPPPVSQASKTTDAEAVSPRPVASSFQKAAPDTPIASATGGKIGAPAVAASASLPSSHVAPEPPPARTPVPEPATGAAPQQHEAELPGGPILFVPPPPPPRAPSIDRTVGPTAVATPASPPEAGAPALPGTSRTASPSGGEPPLVPGGLAELPPSIEAAVVAATPSASIPKPDDAAEPRTVMPPAPPLESPTDFRDEEEREEDGEDWIDEDFEDGEDLARQAESDEPQDPFEDEKAATDDTPTKPAQGGGLFSGGLLSKLKLPSFGRRKAQETEKEPEPVAADEEADDLLEEFEEFEELEEFDELEEETLASEAEALPARMEGPSESALRRLHQIIDQLAAENLLDEALRRTGNRIELRKVEDGLDIVVKGLPAALGKVRLDAADGHVSFQPRFGLDLPERGPNRADLELWLKAMGDVVVHVLADISQRRSKSGGPAGEPGA